MRGKGQLYCTTEYSVWSTDMQINCIVGCKNCQQWLRVINRELGFKIGAEYGWA